VPEAPITLLIPPELPPLGVVRGLPTPALPRAREADQGGTDCGRIVLGVAAVDGSGRVRERVLLAALGWGRGERLEVRVMENALVFSPGVNGSVEVDGRDQVALPSSCRAMLRISPGQRVVLVALPDVNLLLVHPVQVVTAWIGHHVTHIPGLFDD
jgi:redox-sensitive bicupin YhaK (pirin superfamily)